MRRPSQSEHETETLRQLCDMKVTLFFNCIGCAASPIRRGNDGRHAEWHNKRPGQGGTIPFMRCRQHQQRDNRLVPNEAFGRPVVMPTAGVLGRRKIPPISEATKCVDRTIRRHFSIPHRAHNILLAHVVLEDSGIMAIVGELVASRIWPRLPGVGEDPHWTTLPAGGGKG